MDKVKMDKQAKEFLHFLTSMFSISCVSDFTLF